MCLTRVASKSYTLPMKRLRSMSALLPVLALLCMVALAACTSGNLGSEEIAFVRDGNLWTIDPRGTNAFTVVAQSTPVLGYGLSPDHQIFVFRTLDSTFAHTIAGHNVINNPITGLAGDAPGTLNTVGIDGGSPIALITSGSNLTESNAWWSPNGSRLLYREGTNPAAWWVSQNDQPLGIARKSLPDSYSIPSINSQDSIAIGNSTQGIFTTTLAGTNLSFVQRGNLPGHPLPASLERILWQPAHEKPALLYALMPSTQTNGQGQFALMLRTAAGETRVLARCDCRQFAWSPDGNMLLYSTDQGYTVLHLQNGSSFQFNTEHGAVPYWSPDSKALLLDGVHTLTLVHTETRQTQVLLSDGSALVMTDGLLAGSTAAVQPVENSLWNADSQRFVLVTRGRMQWQGQTLLSGNGLYTITLNSQDEPQGMPFLVDHNGHDTQPGWSYEDPNTSFLF
jgi:Tol biopolymer transport system component